LSIETFEKPGVLGICFRRELVGASVHNVRPGSPAAASGRLHRGMQLVALQCDGTSKSVLEYAAVLRVLRSAARPLTLTFMDKAVMDAGEVERDGATVVVALAAPGTLGLRFRDAGGRGVALAHVAAGSQAARHADPLGITPPLAPGLRLLTITLPDGRSYSAATLAFRDVLVLLRAPARPLTLRFKAGLAGVPSAPLLSVLIYYGKILLSKYLQ
jgi:hypothetical protein